MRLRDIRYNAVSVGAKPCLARCAVASRNRAASLLSGAGSQVSAGCSANSLRSSSINCRDCDRSTSSSTSFGYFLRQSGRTSFIQAVSNTSRWLSSKRDTLKSTGSAMIRHQY